MYLQFIYFLFSNIIIITYWSIFFVLIYNSNYENR